MDNPFLLESLKSKGFQRPDLEKDFLNDSGAESNIINIPTWNEIKSLHPILTPIKISNSTRINISKLRKNPTFP